MRILMLSQFYPPIIGGIEQHVHTLSTTLVSRGYDVAVVTMQHAGQPTFEIERGVRIYRIRSTMQAIPGLFSDTKRQYMPPFPDPRATLELRQIMLQERPLIVHAHDWLVRSFLPLKLLSKARLIVTLHNYNLTCARIDLTYQQAACSGPGPFKCLACSAQHYNPLQGPPTVLSNWLLAPLQRRAVDMFLPVSQAVARGNRLARSGVPFQVIPNFIPDDDNPAVGDAAPYLAQLPTDKGFLLFVGGLWRVKGVGVLLRAYADLADPPPLVLIGYKAPDWPQLSAQCPPGVSVFQDWPHYAVMAAWERCAIALIPSIWHEPCPTVAMEAMSMGKPVIAARMGGLTDIVSDHETGLLVTPGDSLALKEAIAELLQDPQRLEGMGQRAKQRVTAFQAQSVVPRIEQVYCDLVRAPLPPTQTVPLADNCM